LRDRAPLLVGVAGALRRSELAGIMGGDRERTDQGYALIQRRSKVSQTDAVLAPYRTDTQVSAGACAPKLARRPAITDGPAFRRVGVPPRRPRDAPVSCPRSAPRRLRRARSGSTGPGYNRQRSRHDA
jgi:hypothetical protein